MGKIIFLILFLVIPAFRCTAEMRAFDCMPEGDRADGVALLDKVQNAYTKVNTLSATFEQDSYAPTMDETQLSEGTVNFKKPGMMKWMYKSPHQQVFIIKGNELWRSDPSTRQVEAQAVEDVLISKLPIAFLAGVGDLKRDFTVVRACRASGGDLILLKPKAAKHKSDEVREGVAACELLVDPETFLPRGVKVTDTSKNVNAIVLAKLQTNPAPAITEAAFDIKVPKGHDFLDYRASRLPGEKSEVGSP